MKGKGKVEKCRKKFLDSKMPTDKCRRGKMSTIERNNKIELRSNYNYDLIS